MRPGSLAQSLVIRTVPQLFPTTFFLIMKCYPSEQVDLGQKTAAKIQSTNSCEKVSPWSQGSAPFDIGRVLLIRVDGLCFSPTFCVGTFLKTLRLCRVSEGQIKRLRVLSLDKKVLTLHIASLRKLVFLSVFMGWFQNLSNGPSSSLASCIFFEHQSQAQSQACGVHRNGEVLATFLGVAMGPPRPHGAQ